MNTRLKQFLAAENISQSQFADTIKVVRASVSHVLSGRNKPGYDFICAIMTAYPSLNIEWLIAGKGKMYKNSPDRDPYMTNPVESMPQYGEDENIPTLFSGENDVDETFQNTSLPVSVSPSNSMSINQNLGDTLSIKNTDNTLQTLVKQRKAIKVTIFYDDGTFQEM